MDQKLQELTEKILEEGVKKGEDQANSIIEDAKNRSKDIIHDAKAEAESIVSKAKKEADDLARTVRSEIQLASRQAISVLKNQITDTITARTIDKDISALLKDPKIILEFIQNIMENWSPDKAEKEDFSIMLPANNQKELEEYFNTQAKALMKKGLEIKFSRDLAGGFQISSTDSSFKISLTDKDFMEFFKQLLRPKIKKVLFDE